MSDERTDNLIERIAADEAGSEEFAEFVDRAKREPGAWRALAVALRDELQMRRALDDALTEAGRLQTPWRANTNTRTIMRTARAPWPTRARIWGGWAVAALLAVAWIVIALPESADPVAEPVAEERSPQPMPAEAPAIRQIAFSADEAYQRYLETAFDEGRVLAELPAVMVETRPLEGDRFEVFFVRQILEREEVDAVYQYAEDELGLPTPVRIDRASFVQDESPL